MIVGVQFYSSTLDSDTEIKKLKQLNSNIINDESEGIRTVKRMFTKINKLREGGPGALR